jgi:hypothetical protein
MRLEAILSAKDVAELVGQFVPLELELGEPGKGDRFVAIDGLSDVKLVPGAGVRVTCTAHLRWPLLGLHLPVRIQSLEILLRPSVGMRGGGQSLIFALTVEHIDIAWSPALVDESLAERVNRELAEHHVELAWNFTKTLSHVFQLPKTMLTAATLGVEVVEGQIHVSQESLRMAVLLRAKVGPRVGPIRHD